jgi:hypothetical protein
VRCTAYTISNPGEIQQLYEMIFAKYELREKRGESLTPHRNYCSYPTAVLDKRTASMTHVANQVEEFERPPEVAVGVQEQQEKVSLHPY